MELTLSGVNEEQRSGAANAKPLEGLFSGSGQPAELLEAGSREGIEGLLEGLLGGSAPGTSSGGGSAPAAARPIGASSPAAQQEYVECLQQSESPADLQKCASLLK